MRVLLQRLLLSVAALAVGSMLIFGATEALPGDLAEAVLGREATAESLAAFRRDVGLDRPLAQRYADWIGGVVQGDLGEAYTARRPVSELVLPRLKNSLLLAAFAIAFTVPIAVLLGLLTALRNGGWFDGGVSGAALVGVALPEFVLGILLAAVFGILWPILPPTSLFSAEDSLLSHLRQVVLPALAAGGVSAGYILRMTRAATLDVLDSDYIQAARLRGVPTRTLMVRHVLRNALIPSVNVIGSNVAWMFGGLVVVETVFAFPGIGSLLVQATVTRDAALVASVALIITAGYIAINLLADLALIALNPRLRGTIR